MQDERSGSITWTRVRASREGGALTGPERCRTTFARPLQPAASSARPLQVSTVSASHLAIGLSRFCLLGLPLLLRRIGGEDGHESYEQHEEQCGSSEAHPSIASLRTVSRVERAGSVGMGRDLGLVAGPPQGRRKKSTSPESDPADASLCLVRSAGKVGLSSRTTVPTVHCTRSRRKWATGGGASIRQDVVWLQTLLRANLRAWAPCTWQRRTRHHICFLRFAYVLGGPEEDGSRQTCGLAASLRR